MDPAGPELPRRPSRATAPRARMLIAAAGTALLAVTCTAAAAAARDNSPRSGQLPANLSADTTSALTSNWYESAPYYSVLDSGAPDLGTVMAATGQGVRHGLPRARRRTLPPLVDGRR